MTRSGTPPTARRCPARRRRREMRHQHDIPDLGICDRRAWAREGCGHEAPSRFMPEFILEEHGVLLRSAASQSICACQWDVPQPQARAQLQVARLEHALQQQDGAAPAERARARPRPGRAGETVGAAQTVVHVARCRGRRRWSLTTAQTGARWMPGARRQVVAQGVGWMRAWIGRGGIWNRGAQPGILAPPACGPRPREGRCAPQTAHRTGAGFWFGPRPTRPRTRP